MPPPTATLRPEPVRPGGKKESSSAPSSSSKPAADKMPRPDQVAYNAEQDQLNKEIAQVREEMVSPGFTSGARGLFNLSGEDGRASSGCERGQSSEQSETIGRALARGIFSFERRDTSRRVAASPAIERSE